MFTKPGTSYSRTQSRMASRHHGGGDPLQFPALPNVQQQGQSQHTQTFPQQRKAYAPYVPGPLEQRQAANARLFVDQQLQMLQQPQRAPLRSLSSDRLQAIPRPPRVDDDEEDPAISRTQASRALMLPVRVLAIDGASGPAAALLPLAVLGELERRAGGVRASKLFDIVVGTGTGAAAAIAVARSGTTYTAGDIAHAFYERAGAVAAKAASAESHPRTAVSAALEDALRSIIGDGSLRSCCINCAVTAYDLKRKAPVVLRSWDAQTAMIPTMTAARAAVSTVGLFDPVEVDGMSLVDASIAGVCPALTAWAEARRMNPSSSNFLIVSLGCGPVGRGFQGAVGDASGEALDDVVRAMANAPVVTMDHSMRVLLGGNYVRIDSERALDTASAEEVHNEAEKIVAAFSGTLDSLSQRLLKR